MPDFSNSGERFKGENTGSVKSSGEFGSLNKRGPLRRTTGQACSSRDQPMNFLVLADRTGMVETELPAQTCEASGGDDSWLFNQYGKSYFVFKAKEETANETAEADLFMRNF